LTSPPLAVGAPPVAGAGMIAGVASKSNKFISAGGYSTGIIAFGFSSLSLSLSFLLASIPINNEFFNFSFLISAAFGSGLYGFLGGLGTMIFYYSYFLDCNEQ